MGSFLEGLTITGAVLFIIAVWRFFHYLEDRKKKKLKEIPIESVSSVNVLKEYMESTPLQRKRFKSSYKGVKVKWHIEYYEIASINRLGSKVTVTSNYHSTKLLQINFKTDLKKFPIIKSAKEGDNYIVTGLVDKVTDNTIYLKLIDIEKDSFFTF